MASVEKRADGRWRARWREHAGGPQRARHFDRKIDAERYLDRIRGDLVRGTYTDPNAGRLTLADWWDRYRREVPKRPTTAARDAAVMRQWWLPTLGGVRLADLSPSAVRVVVDRMATELAPGTVRTDYGVFRAVLAAAVEADLISRSPCRGIRLPSTDRQPPRFLTADELHRLAAAMPVEWRPMVYVAGILGLRWSEVAGLRVGRVDFLRRTVAVVETVAEVEGQLIFGDVKTKTSRRTVGAPPAVMEMLAEHLARRGRPGPDGLVFVAPGGGPLRAGNFRRRVWAPAVASAGLEGLTFHGLRHSAVGFMIELGAHPRVIQQRMGHASIRTTFDVYGSVLPAVDEAVTAGLGELIRAPGDRLRTDGVSKGSEGVPSGP